MKQALYAFLAGLAIGAMAVLLLDKPCQDVITPPPVVVRDAERDSLRQARAIRAVLIDSLLKAKPRRERNIQIVRSLSRAAQLDSLLADPR